MGEDRHFSYCCYACAKKIWQLPYNFYHYFYNPNSACRFNYSEKKIDDDVKSLKMTELFMQERGIDKMDASIIKTKIYIKECCYLKLSEPNFNKWREIFPEIKFSSLFVEFKCAIFNLMILFHLDFILKKILKIYRKIKPNN